MEDRDFSQIVGQTKKVVLSAISKYLNREYYEAIDDVAQETYLRAYRHLTKGKFREEAALSTWLYQIAKNESLRMNQKMARQNKKVISEDLTEMEFRLDSGMNKIFDEDDFLDRETFWTLLQRLPEKYQVVLKLIARGYDNGEISQKLEISPGTVKSRTSRGKEMMRKLYYKGTLIY